MTTPSRTYDHLVKTLLVGSSGVGKSCLLKRFTDDEFVESFISTIGVDFGVKTLEIDGKLIKLQMWDTAGQERFRTITSAYYRGASAVMIVFDVTDYESFANIAYWVKEVRHYTDAQLVLVANKVDLTSRRVVRKEDAEALARELGIPLMETSAKNSENVDKAFIETARRFVECSACLQNSGLDRSVVTAGKSVSLMKEDSSLSSKCCTIM